MVGRVRVAVVAALARGRERRVVEEGHGHVGKPLALERFPVARLVGARAAHALEELALEHAAEPMAVRRGQHVDEGVDRAGVFELRARGVDGAADGVALEERAGEESCALVEAARG